MRHGESIDAGEQRPLLRRGDSSQLDSNNAQTRRAIANGPWLGPDVEVGDTVNSMPISGKHGNTDDFLMIDISKTQFWLVFGGILSGYFIAAFDSTLMASSHPVITSYFNASNSASWLSTAFMLTSTAFQPLFGRLSDTIGRKPLYLFSMTMFAATTAWCALAQSIGSFIAARAFCGLGAGGVFAMGAIMTSDLITIEARGTFQAYINLFFGVGSTCGAAFGGFLCDSIGWRWTFGIQLPPILIISVAAFFTTPHSMGPHLLKDSEASAWEHIKSFDLAGSFLLSTSVGLLILGLNLGGNVFPWRHPLVISSLILALVSGVFLVIVECKHPRPVMPINILFSKPRGYIIFHNFFSNIGINTIIFNAPLFFQAVKLDSPSQSGFRLALPSLGLTTFGVSTGFFITKTGRMQPPFVAGGIAMLLGSACLTSMWDGIPTSLAMLFVLPSAIGQGLSFPASAVAVLATSEKQDQAVVLSTLALWRSLGTVMGIALSSLILQDALTAYLMKFITGKHKDEIIYQVRKNVRSIIDLDPKHQQQVIKAYEYSMRWTFASSILAFIVVVLLAVPAKIPRLKRREPNGTS